MPKKKYKEFIEKSLNHEKRISRRASSTENLCMVEDCFCNSSHNCCRRHLSPFEIDEILDDYYQIHTESGAIIYNKNTSPIYTLDLDVIDNLYIRFKEYFNSRCKDLLLRAHFMKYSKEEGYRRFYFSRNEIESRKSDRMIKQRAVGCCNSRINGCDIPF